MKKGFILNIENFEIKKDIRDATASENQKMSECDYKINICPERQNLSTKQVFDEIKRIDSNDCKSGIHAQAGYFYHHLYKKENAKELIELMAGETEDIQLSKYIHVFAILSRSTFVSKKKTDYIYKPLFTVIQEKKRRKF
jgi:hypothetical protein